MPPPGQAVRYQAASELSLEHPGYLTLFMY